MVLRVLLNSFFVYWADWGTSSSCIYRKGTSGRWYICCWYNPMGNEIAQTATPGESSSILWYSLLMVSFLWNKLIQCVHNVTVRIISSISYFACVMAKSSINNNLSEINIYQHLHIKGNYISILLGAEGWIEGQPIHNWLFR